MNWQVRKVAVLGSGVMGSAIAAHFEQDFSGIRNDQTAAWSDWARFAEGERRVGKTPRPEDVPSLQ